MSISGNFSAMPPEDLFQWISRGQKSGILYVRSGNDTRNIFVYDGSVVAVNSSRLRDRLGSILIQSQGLKQETLDKLIAEQSRTGTFIGELVIREGLITKKQLNEALEEQVQSIVFEVLGWVSGDFSFEERELKDSERLILPLKISNLLLEGARRRDEMSRYRTVIPSENAVYRKTSPDASIPDPNNQLLTRIFNMLENPIAVKEIIERLYVSELAVYDCLNRLLEAGAIVRDLDVENARIRIDVSIASTMQRVKTLVESKYFHEAIESLITIIKQAPLHNECRAELKRVEKLLLTDARKLIESPDLVPKIRQSFSSIQPDNLQLTLQEGFVFSRIDGRTNIKMLKYVTSLSEDTLYVILHKFIRMGLAYLDKAPGAVKR